MRKIFISYHHHNDQYYKDWLVQNFDRRAFIDRSVDTGDIATDIAPDTIRRVIRDNYLRDSSVTIVLIGAETYKRKHVDWEIGSSIRNTDLNPRSGLLGIILPTRVDYNNRNVDFETIPPRLCDNFHCEFATIKVRLPQSHEELVEWIEEAYRRKTQYEPDNSYPGFMRNR